MITFNLHVLLQRRKFLVLLLIVRILQTLKLQPQALLLFLQRNHQLEKSVRHLYADLVALHLLFCF